MSKFSFQNSLWTTEENTLHVITIYKRVPVLDSENNETGEYTTKMAKRYAINGWGDCRTLYNFEWAVCQITGMHIPSAGSQAIGWLWKEKTGMQKVEVFTDKVDSNGQKVSHKPKQYDEVEITQPANLTLKGEANDFLGQADYYEAFDLIKVTTFDDCIKSLIAVQKAKRKGETKDAATIKTEQAAIDALIQEQLDDDDAECYCQECGKGGKPKGMRWAKQSVTEDGKTIEIDVRLCRGCHTKATA